jgi:pre-mRNA-processing factor 39
MQTISAGSEHAVQTASIMSNISSFPDYSYSRDPELLQLAKQVVSISIAPLNRGRLADIPFSPQRDDLDDIDNWGRLVDAAQAQEGGLNRNSNPQAISSTRETFDFLLARFPLFFGFWKKYADLEFTIGGPEAAEMVS